MKLYTKKGDKGTTSLLGGGLEVYKHTPQVEICGIIDELNSHVGLAIALSDHFIGGGLFSIISKVCDDLFHLGAEMASAHPMNYVEKNDTTITDERVEHLESYIDYHQDTLPELKNFIMPTGSPAAAQLFVARSVARRLERRVVEYKFEVCEPMGLMVRDTVLRYLNRLSDFLFVMARCINRDTGMPKRKPAQIEWKPKEK